MLNVKELKYQKEAVRGIANLQTKELVDKLHAVCKEFINDEQNPLPREVKEVVAARACSVVSVNNQVRYMTAFEECFKTAIEKAEKEI